MKIISKRGRSFIKDDEGNVSADIGEISIILQPGAMTTEERERAEKAIRELRKKLEEIGKVLDDGWYR